MDLYWLYIKLGYEHVIDINGLDHFYFLIALTIPFQFKDWKKLVMGQFIHNWSLFSAIFLLL